MLTTFLTGLPVWPFHSPERTFSAKPAIFSRTSCTGGTTSSPSRTMDSPFGARKATWRTARPSVTLIFSPANMASIRPLRPVSSARPSRSESVSSVIRFFE